MKNYESCSESESYCESHHESKCKKPKKLYLTSSRSSPDTLFNLTNLTSLTSGVLSKIATHSILTLRDRNNIARGTVEATRTISIFTNKPDTIYGLETSEYTLIVNGKEEKYSLVVNEDETLPLVNRQFFVGSYKLTSIQGKATYSKVDLSFRTGQTDADQDFFFVFY